ncbi:hypothetical protein I4U23_010801 [Adineta vaga]|nr:hypothetical protein I4U23_010801 [Adineta vaga]
MDANRLIPLAKSLTMLIALQIACGISTGMVMGTMPPTLVALVDKRHSSADYTTAFALLEMALSLSFLLECSICQINIDCRYYNISDLLKAYRTLGQIAIIPIADGRYRNDDFGSP